MSLVHNPMRFLPLLVAQSALSILSGVAYVPSFPAMAEEFAVPIADIQATLTVYFLALAGGQIIIGPMSDHMGRRPIMIAGLMVSTLGAIACAFAPSIELVMLARILQALGSCAGFVVTRAVIREIFPREDASRAMSYLTAGVALAPAAAPILGGFIQDSFGWRATFIFLGLVASATLALLYRKLPETNPGANVRARETHFFAHMIMSYSRLLRSRSFVGLGLVTMAIFFGLFGYTAVAPELIITQMGHAPREYGLMAAIVPLGFMAGSFLSARLGRTLETRWLVEIGIAIQILSGGLMALLALLDIHNAAALIGPMTLWSVGMGLCLANLVVLTMSLFPAIAGAASALSGFMQTMGSSGGSGAMQFLPHTNLVTGVMVLLFALLALAAWKGLGQAAAKHPY